MANVFFNLAADRIQLEVFDLSIGPNVGPLVISNSINCPPLSRSSVIGWKGFFKFTAETDTALRFIAFVISDCEMRGLLPSSDTPVGEMFIFHRDERYKYIETKVRFPRKSNPAAMAFELKFEAVERVVCHT